MKHLINDINEGIFGDNIKSAIKINGIEIYEPEWKQCEEYFKKRRKEYFGNMQKVSLGDLYTEYNIVYNEDDCVVAVTESDEDVYILSPETIYMCYEASCVMGSNYSFSLNNIDDANDFDISFNWYSPIGWTWISGAYSNNRRHKMKEAGFKSLVGYIPSTISKKAQDIIKKYTKN